jgi:hypothetical protein
MAQEHVDVVKRLVEGYIAGDLEAAFSTVHPEIVLHEAAGLPFGGEWVGLEGFQKLLGTIMADYQLEVLAYEASDTGAGAMVRMDTRFTARSSGAVLDMPIVELYGFTDGLISDVDVFYKDTRAVVELAAAAHHPATPR